MRIRAKKLRRAFTLLELTMALAIGMVIGGIVLAMFNQQIAFLRIFRAQSFLSEEAPLVGSHISKLLMNAERYQLFANFNDAERERNATLDESPVIRIYYRQIDGTPVSGILSFDPIAGRLDYYVETGGVFNAPQWAVTTRAEDVKFLMQSGIIRCQLTGPADEQITFSGSMQ